MPRDGTRAVGGAAGDYMRNDMAKKSLTVAKAEQFEGNVLMRMRMENCKRVRLIDLTFDQPLTIIGGDFSQGKSTYLSGFEWVFGDKRFIDADPIQTGKQSGTIELDIGDGEKVNLRVHCTLERVGESGFNRITEIEIPGYLTPPRIQEFLEKLAGRASFDPMHFNGLAADKQYETLRRLVSDFDFEDNAATAKAVYDERTKVNADQEREQTAADAIEIADKAPHMRVDEAELTTRLTQAGQTKADIQTRKTRRENAAAEIIRLQESAVATRAKAEPEALEIRSTAERDLAELEQQLADLKATIERRRTRIEADIEANTASLSGDANKAEHDAAVLQKRLDEAEPLPEDPNTEAIAAELNKGRETNRALTEWETQRDRKAEHQKKADEHAAKARELTRQYEDLKDARRKAIEQAQLPVEGIGFGDGFVTLNGAPWKQAGEAERVDASTAIGMALNPPIKTILIRNGSGVAKSLRDRIRARAAEKKYRVLMEVVDTPAGTTVVIEDGAVKEIRDHQAESVPA